MDFGKLMQLKKFKVNKNTGVEIIIIPENFYFDRILMYDTPLIRKSFQLQPTLKSHAQSVLTRIKNFRHKTQNNDVVFVSIHVRRQDYIQYLRKFLDKKFYFKAIEYYEAKYKNVIFVVASDDPTWCHKNFIHKPNVFIVSKSEPNSVYKDFAVLTQCNHSIIDYGTYGIMAAVITGGEVIAPDNKTYPVSDLVLSETVFKEVPNWKAI